MKNNSHSSENESHELLSKNYENINYFNKNFICNDVKEIIALYKKNDKGTWNHPLLMNNNYCIICGDKYKAEYEKKIIINDHMNSNICEFLEKKNIKFRKVKKKNEKIISRRFIKSTDTKITSKELVRYYDKEQYESDTDLFLPSVIVREKIQNTIEKGKKSHRKKEYDFSKRMSLDIKKTISPKVNSKHKLSNIFTDDNNENINVNNHHPITTVNNHRENAFFSKKKNQISTAKESIMKIFNMFSGENKPKPIDEKEIDINNKIDITTTPRVNTYNNIRNSSFTDTNEEKINKNELCEICLGPISDKIVINCGDFYCRNCIKDLIQGCINDISKFKNIKCPKETCGEPIDDNIIENLLSKDEFDKYKKFKIRIKGLTNKSLIPCPFPDCDGFAEEKNVKKNIAVCTLQKHFFCRNCLKIVSLESNNIENLYEHVCDKKKDETLKYLNTNKFIKKCPACHTWVEREPGGCNNMTCQNIWCGYEFCWICETMYDSSHYKNPFSICFGLEKSDYTSKFSQYKSARVAKCIVIFLFLIFIAMPIVVALFSFVIVAVYIVTYILDGSTIKNIVLKNSILHSTFTGIAYAIFVVVSIALIPLGYISLAILIVSLPVLYVVHKCKRQKEEE